MVGTFTRRRALRKLVIGLPSKGRIQEHCEQFFTQSGLSIIRNGGVRNYQGNLKEIEDVEIAFLSASAVSKELATGAINFGITGLDLVRENIANCHEKVYSITPLEFSHANVVLAVPRAWIDVTTIEDLNDVASDYRTHHGHRMRIATKFLNLTTEFLAKYGITEYRIVESIGATEGAPAAGSAELIVDLSSTGSTLRDNDLKILEDGVILESQAHLFVSKNAEWDSNTIRIAKHFIGFINHGLKVRSIVEIDLNSPLF